MQAPFTSAVSPESISKAGAGALLLAVAIVELALDFWAAGWWQRSCALLVVAVGAALLSHGTAAIGRELGWTVRYPIWRPGFAGLYAKPSASTATPIRTPAHG